MTTKTTAAIEIERESSNLNISEGYSGDVIREVFVIDDEKRDKIKRRLDIKSYGITNTVQSDEADGEIARIDRKNFALREVMQRTVPLLTPEYIFLKRRGFINNILECLSKIISDINQDEFGCKIALELLKNEFENIYRNFLKTEQDEEFLSIVSVFEYVLFSKELDKKVIKIVISVLKNIKDKRFIEYEDYESVVRCFVQAGIDVISIQSFDDES